MAEAKFGGRSYPGSTAVDFRTRSESVGGETRHVQGIFVPVRAPIIVHPTLESSALSVGDVAGAQFLISNIGPGNDIPFHITGMSVLDKSDQAFSGILTLMKANVSLGTANSAISMSKTGANSDAEQIVAEIPFYMSEFLDRINFKRWERHDFAKKVTPVSGTANLYGQVSIIEGNPTFGAHGDNTGLYITLWTDY